jgi:hypothetical protein
MVDTVLRNINEQAGLPVHVHQLDTKNLDKSSFFLPYKPDSYVILTVKPLHLLISQLQALWSLVPFNPHARFIFVITGSFDNINVVLEGVINSLWLKFKIANLVFVIPRHDSLGCDVNEDMYGLADTRNIDIYSWFPFKGNYCAENFNAVLMDQCGRETLDTFLHNGSLFPNKIPHKFAGCLSTVFVSVLNPYSMLTDNYTDSNGRTVLKLAGISVKFVSLVAEALNLTLNYRICRYHCRDEQHPLAIEVFVGFKPLTIKAIQTYDTTIPYIFDALKWFVPCPKSALRFDRILSLFSSSVWFTMLLVVSLTALVFWSSVRLLVGALMKEPYGYRTVMYCLQNVWSVYMGVSVPAMPRTYRVRALFMLFVWYSFAMSTIFQSFFISFLVIPGYDYRISSLNDLNRSGLKYASNSVIDKALRRFEYVEHDNLNLDRFECADPDKCMQRLFTESDTTFVATTFQAQSVASRIGKTPNKNLLCTLDENIFSSMFVMCFYQGYPLIDRFNIVIRRCIEAGIGDKYWSDLYLNLTLQSMRKLEETNCQVCSDTYFVFSLTHLRVAFIVLEFGYVMSVAAFVAELIFKWLTKRRTVTVNIH